MGAAGKFTIYHNPRCSKSRETLQMLREQGLEPEIIEYLKAPPSAARLAELLALMGLSAREVMRKKEAAYKELGLDDPELSEKDLVMQMAAHPVLIERPIVVAGARAKLCRPPETVRELFE